MKNHSACVIVVALAIAAGCAPNQTQPEMTEDIKERKIVLYQVFTRLFGNTNTTDKPWGTIEENGVGKFSDFTDKALDSIRVLGVTHIWYTGVPHHAVIRDYTAYGISNDDPDVVKGRAGSPYAVKDYYNVDPDLAEAQAFKGAGRRRQRFGRADADVEIPVRGEGGELRRGEERVFQVIAVAGEGDGLLRPPGEVARDPDRHPAPPPRSLPRAPAYFAPACCRGAGCLLGGARHQFFRSPESPA